MNPRRVVFPVCLFLFVLIIGSSQYAHLFTSQINARNKLADIDFGVPITDLIDPVGDEDDFTFTATAGYRITAFLTEGSVSGSLRLFLYDSERTQLASCTTTNTCEIRDYLIIESGSYTLTVDGSGPAVGDYTLALHRLDNDVLPINYDESTAGLIEPVGDEDGFAFAARAGSRITAFLAEGSVDGSLRLYLYDSERSQLASCTTTNTCEIRDYTLIESGSYSLAVDGSSAATGNYTLALNCLTPDCSFEPPQVTPPTPTATPTPMATNTPPPGATLTPTNEPTRIASTSEATLMPSPTTPPTLTPTPTNTPRPGTPTPVSMFAPVIMLPFNETEPNGNLSQANGPIPSHRTVFGNFNSGDQSSDYYLLDLPFAYTIKAILTNIPAGHDYDLTVWSPDNLIEPLAHSGNIGSSDENTLTELLPRGRYYIRVYNPLGTTTDESYHLTVFYLPAIR